MFTRARGREVIFWQSARTARQARPNVALPTRRASGRVFEIQMDSHERYAWSFTAQQATTRRQALPSGDYAVEVGGTVVAAVEPKSLADLVATLTTGRLRYVLAALADLPRATLVVEDRYAAVFKLPHVRPGLVAEGLAEAQVRFPQVPVVFCETRSLAQEWTYRFLGAALVHHQEDAGVGVLADAFPVAGPLRPTAPSPAAVRAWALAQGYELARTGRIPRPIADAYAAAHPAR